MKKIKLGLQMHAVREDFSISPSDTLKKVKKMGYQGVEFNYSALNLSAAKYRAMLDECGLECFGVLVDWDNLKPDTLTKTMADVRILGTDKLIVGSVPKDVLTSEVDAHKKAVEYLNELYTTMTKLGFKTGYHNHDTDFEITYDGKSFFEYVMDNTPDEFMAVIDTGNAEAGGADSFELMKKYAERAQIVHIKGYSAEKKYVTPVWENDFELDKTVEFAVASDYTGYLDIEFGARGEYVPLERAARSCEWVLEHVGTKEKKMRVGWLVNLNENPYECIRHAAVDMGFKSGQLSVWDMKLYTKENADAVKRACEDFDFEPTAVWCGWSGPHDWKYPGMYATIGLVPPDWRAKRVEDILKGAWFARMLGIKDIITHAGYMPDNPFDIDRIGVMKAIQHICREIGAYGQRFLFETGEMIPVTLTQLIKDIDEPNIGINFDCANMIINNRGNSADALKILLPFVCGVHTKDAVYPEGLSPKGKEVKVGEGDADFPKLVRILASSGYCGDLTIEREIEDITVREADVKDTKLYLEKLITKTKEDTHA